MHDEVHNLGGVFFIYLLKSFYKSCCYKQIKDEKGDLT